MNIQQQIQQEISKWAQSNRFNVANIPRHIHNDIDSPFAFQPFITFAGVINTAGTAALLPQGWKVSSNGSGVYTVVHSLNTMLYACVATPLDALSSASIPQILQGLNEVEITMFAPTGGANNTDFSFLLINVNNKATKLPTYYGTLITHGTYT